MGSTYLQGGDAAAFGVSGATAGQIQNASAIVDAFLQRPEGMVWVADAAAWPCFMAALSPFLTLMAGGAIAAGTAVVVPVTGGMINADLIGEVLIIDRATPGSTEACVIQAVGTTSITLQTVTRPHNGGCLLEGGLVILEERALPAKRSVTRVSRTPVARLIASAGRYAYGRRSDQMAGLFYEPSILASVQMFGGPPVWSAFNPSDCGVSMGTGEVYIPAGQLVAAFSDVRLRYVAGFPFSALPTAIKQATATVVAGLMSFPEMSGNIKKLQAGGTAIERFGDSLLDAETRGLLAPFQAKLYF